MVQRCRGVEVQRCRGALVQRCRGTYYVHRCRGIEVQRYRGALVEMCKGGAPGQRCRVGCRGAEVGGAGTTDEMQSCRVLAEVQRFCRGGAGT